MQKDNLTLDKMELYATIKYVKYEDLIKLLKEPKLKLTTKNINWLTKKVLPNIVKILGLN